MGKNGHKKEKTRREQKKRRAEAHGARFFSEPALSYLHPSHSCVYVQQPSDMFIG
jgi:hypothetical protein